jgi:hypothetical protein
MCTILAVASRHIPRAGTTINPAGDNINIIKMGIDSGPKVAQRLRRAADPKVRIRATLHKANPRVKAKVLV